MDILQLVVAAMLQLTPEQGRPTATSPQLDTYVAIAGGIEEAVSQPLEGVLPFSGPAAKEASALALAAVARNESGYREDVRKCTVKGDAGRSVSAFQLYRGTSRRGYSEAAICADDALAARLSLGVLSWYRTVPTVTNMFQGYASGNSTFRSRGSSNQAYMFSQLVSGRIRIQHDRASKTLRADFINDPNQLSLNNVILRDEHAAIYVRLTTLTPQQ